MSTKPGILFSTARPGGRYIAGVPDDVKMRIVENIDAFDQVLRGFRHILEDSQLHIVYDPQNHHQVFEHQVSRGAYHWPSHTMYLGKSGIKRSIIHEGAHILDILAGPTIAQCQAKFGRADSIPYSVYHFWPEGGKFKTGSDKPDYFSDSKRGFVFVLACEALIARQDQAAKAAVLKKLYRASVTDVEQNGFIADRISNLAEEWVFTWQTDHRVPRRGVGGKKYFSAPTFWGSDWIRKYEKPIFLFFKGMIDTINDRFSDGTLTTKLEELRRSF